MTGSRTTSDEPVTRRRLLLVSTAAATLGLGTTAAAERAEQSASTEDPAWHTLTLDGQGTTSRTVYEFTVSGDLEARAGIGRDDDINGSTAEGFVRGGTDTYAFTGELVSYELQRGDGVLSIDGMRVATAKRPWRTLTLDGKGTRSRTDYEFTIAGQLREREGLGQGDELTGKSAEGFVRGGVDGYYFVGKLKEYELQGGDGVLLVDGKQLTSADEEGADDGERDDQNGSGKGQQSGNGKGDKKDKGEKNVEEKGEGGGNEKGNGKKKGKQKEGGKGKDKSEGEGKKKGNSKGQGKGKKKGQGKGKKSGKGHDHEEEEDGEDDEDDD